MGNCINSSLSRTIEHPQLGQLEKEYHQNYTVEYFKTVIKISSKDKYQKWASEVKKMRYNTETKNVLFMPQKIVLHQGDLFNKETSAEVFYEPFIETLSDMMHRYRTNKCYPSQELLWYLIYTLIKVGKYFQKINTKIGNITTSNIVVSANKQLRVIGEKSTLEFIPPIEQIQLKLSDKALLAPEQINYLNKIQTKNPEDEINPQLSQVYSIGILVLGVSCLFEPHHFYEYKPNMSKKISIDFLKVQTVIEELTKTKRISELLLQTIRQMIEVKPEKRIKSTQLFKRLSEYQNQILTKKDINYSGEEISRIKESLNGSFVTRTLNNSFQTNGNRSLQNQSISFRVSEISQAGQGTSRNQVQDRYNNANYFRKHTGFMNIL